MLIVSLLLTNRVLLSQEYNLLSTAHNTFFSEHNGDLWIASTSKGYNRFDGIATGEYVLNDTLSGLEGTYIQSELFEGRDGNLWTSTSENLCFYSQDQDRFFCNQLVIEDDTLVIGYHVFHIDERNRLWLRANEKMLIYDIGQKKVVSNLGHTKGNSFAFKNDTIIAAPWLNDIGFEVWIKRDDVWGVSKRELADCSNYEDIQIIKVLWVGDSLWLLSNLGLILYDFNSPCNSEQYLNSTKENLVYNDFSHQGSYIFLGADNLGIQVFDLNEKVFINSLETKWNNVDYIYPSLSDKIIYSDYRFGVSSIRKSLISQKFKSINQLNTTWKKIVNKKHAILLINSKGDLIKVDKKNEVNTPIASDIEDATFFDDAYVVLAKKYDLVIANLNNGKRTAVPHSWTQFQSLRILNKTIYIQADNTLYKYVKKSNLDFDEVVSINHQKQIQAIGTPYDSVIPYAFDNTFINFNRGGIDQTYDVGQYVNDMLFWPKTNELFVATNNGLHSLSYNHNENFVLTPIIASSAVFDDLMIYHDELYFNTESRIGKYNLINQEYVLSKYINSHIRPVYSLEKDSIYTATDHIGVSSILDFFEKAYGDLRLTKFAINNKAAEIIEGVNLNLSFDQNKISWSASIDDWAHANLATIEYQLLPDQKNWITVENHSVVELLKLLPNKYTLNIRGIYSTGNMSEITSYQLRVLNRWHNTLLAKLCFVLLTGFLFYRIYKYRVRQLKRKNKIKEEIRQLEKSALQAQMNPHFIFNCLNSIQSFIMDNDKEKAMDYLGRFAQLIRSNLNASIEPRISLFEEISILDNYLSLEQLRLNNKFIFTIECAPGIDVDHTFIPPMLIQPFAENAVIHGMSSVVESGIISIKFSKEKSGLAVVVKDNGKLSANKNRINTHKSVGVNITKKRLAHINQKSSDQVNVVIDHQADSTVVSLSIAL